jgi:hypothetical protein
MKYLALILTMLACNPGTPPQWTPERARAWKKERPWIVGANFVPSTAVNQLEMWQRDSFDPFTIDRELGYAAGLGMNTVRVFLHDLAWMEDPRGFLDRVDQFLNIAGNYGIRTVFVFFDDCWNESGALGRQPAPKTGVHNSRWVRSPTKHVHDDPTEWAFLERYMKDVLTRFAHDPRVLMWDLYNEPGNGENHASSLALLEKAFDWAWAVRPNQPLTSGTWYRNDTLTAVQLTRSDVITFHNYENAQKLEREIQDKIALGRPVICTEYMARTKNSRFETHLPVFQKYDVGAINWGLVAGKSNTIYAWDAPQKDGGEPKEWFHDIFRADGTPYRPKEIAVLRRLTGKDPVAVH